MRPATRTFGSQKANVHLEKHAHSSMTRTRKAKGRDEPRSPAPRGAPHRNSKGDGKVSDDGSAKDTPFFLVKARQGKRTDYLAQTSRKEVVKGKIHVFMGMLPNVQNSKRWMDANSETSVYTNTLQKSLNEKANWASITINIQSNDERQMQLRKIQSDDKIRFWVGLYRLANYYVLKKGKIGTYTGSHPDRISKSTKSKRSNIRGKTYRMDFENGRDSKESILDFDTKEWTQFQVRVLRTNIDASNRVPRAMFLHLLDNFGSKRIHCGLGSFASYDQQKWFGSRRTGCDSQVEGSIRYYDCKWTYSYDERGNSICLWCGHVCSSSIIERITHGTLAGKIVRSKRLLVWMASRSAIISHQPWRNIECNTGNHTPLVIPRVRATEHWTKAMDDLRQTRAEGDHELRLETKLPELL